MSEKVRVLVVDDSALMRKMISQILQRDESIEVVGTAIDGSFALRKIEERRPHVVTLDLDMPRMDGMETLRQITRTHKLPVIIVSSHSTAGASATFKALALGAFDFVAKPRDAAQAQMEEIAAELIGKIKVAAHAGMGPIAPEPSAAAGEQKRPPKAMPRARAAATRVVAIGISTGGPNALQYLLSQLPPDFPGAIVVVQHMPEGFTDMFARRLDQCCAIEVKEARSGDMLLAGRALVCPGNRHMRVKRMPLGDIVVLSDDPRVNGHRPSIDVTFKSLAKVYGARSAGILLTGMGSDGAAGLLAVREVGGVTMVQDEASCAAFAMPRAAIELGAAQQVLSPAGLSRGLNALHVERVRSLI